MIKNNFVFSYFKYPFIFFQVISQFITIFNQLETEDSENAKKSGLKLNTLCHALIYLHPGYIELYVPLMEVLRVSFDIYYLSGCLAQLESIQTMLAIGQMAPVPGMLGWCMYSLDLNRARLDTPTI